MLHPSLVHPEYYEILAAGDRILSRAFQPSASKAQSRSLLWGPDAPRSEVLLLRQGWACRFRRLPGEKRSILDIYLPGDLIGIGGLLAARCSDAVMALTPVMYQPLEYQEMYKQMKQRDVLLRLLHEADREQARIEALTVGLARRDATGRVAAMLLGLFQRLRRRQLVTGRSFRLPLTQQEIGDHLGLTVVHVNRVMRHLREVGARLASPSFTTAPR